MLYPFLFDMCRMKAAWHFFFVCFGFGFLVCFGFWVLFLVLVFFSGAKAFAKQEVLVYLKGGQM